MSYDTFALYAVHALRNSKEKYYGIAMAPGFGVGGAIPASISFAVAAAPVRVPRYGFRLSSDVL